MQKKRNSIIRLLLERKFLFNEQIIHLTLTIDPEKYLDNIVIEEWIGLADKKIYSGKTTERIKSYIND